MFSFRGREKEETRRRRKKKYEIFKKKKPGTWNLEPGGGEVEREERPAAVADHAPSLQLGRVFFSNLTAFSGNLFALAFSSSGWKEKKTEKSRSSSRRNKEKNADFCSVDIFFLIFLAVKKKNRNGFFFPRREREKKGRKKQQKKKDENQRERPSPLPFGRSEIICGTRWAAAADLIDCAPNDRKIT